MLDKEIHRTKLIKILKDIYSDSTLGPLLGFKGGTAAYFFYDLPRFSVDLDFDLLYPEKGDYAYQKIEKILANYGEFKDNADKRNSYLLAISYMERHQNLKVEVYKGNQNNQYELKSFQGITMQVMLKEDMFANKLLAITGRQKTAVRDFYDAWFFLKQYWDFNEEIIQEKTSKTPREYLQELISYIEEYSNENILNELGYLLDEKQKAWAKAYLKEELIFGLKLRLNGLSSSAG